MQSISLNNYEAFSFNLQLLPTLRSKDSIVVSLDPCNWKFDTSCYSMLCIIESVMKIYRMITLYNLNYKLYMKSGRELEAKMGPYSLLDLTIF